MAENKPGPSKTQRHKHTLDISPALSSFIEELELPDDVKNLILANQTLKRFQLKVDPAEIALLGGGFYLGYAMNMRPGIEVPSPLGGTFFLGLPDFGGKVTDLMKEIAFAEEALAIVQTKVDALGDEDPMQACIDRANAAFLGEGPEGVGGHRDTFRLASDVQFCQSQGDQFQLQQQLEILARLQGELRKHRIAQGFLFLIMTWTLTRPGFLQGIGEIIPG